MCTCRTCQTSWCVHVRPVKPHVYLADLSGFAMTCQACQALLTQYNFVDLILFLKNLWKLNLILKKVIRTGKFYFYKWSDFVFVFFSKIIDYLVYSLRVCCLTKFRCQSVHLWVCSTDVRCTEYHKLCWCRWWSVEARLWHPVSGFFVEQRETT